MNSSLSSNKNKEYVGAYLVLTLLVTTFLFFIDEGYYNFNWIYSWGNWAAFVIYSTGIFSGQILTQHFLFKKLPNATRILLSFLVGGGLGFGVVVLLLTRVI